ncbi:hypothetical protein PPYR_13797 [Photinus pyralis]|uniref:G-protein coupled receptors family 1 profile domain-containing protein n=1 Tax=Photinus pyralis TaxID=7054 RepID=A0A1Y1NC97_PHOPY|nr:uncharacterized protein LOC116178913 [Photinus pyralis]KAB0794177.1 hypothetical protein PPYR_13797 [Photinus pyralis]
MTSLGLTVPLSIATLIGLILNAYILIVVVLTRQAATANNILLLHLGALNTVLALLFLAFSAPGLTRSNWLSSGAPCALHGFLFTILHPMVLWTICGLNCDRYYAIAAPLHYGHLVNPRKILVGLGAGWAVTLALSLPPFFTVGPYAYNSGLGACAPDFSLGPGVLWYSAFYTAFTLLLPATLIVCCNLKILMIARYHRHRIASAIYEVTLSAQVTITHQRNPFFVPTVTAPSAGGPKFRGKSAISTVLQLVGSFLLIYVPYYSIILWEAATATLKNSTTSIKIDQRVLIFASVMLICSPPINGFFYGVKNKTLRKTFQNYWRKKLTKSEVNQEIQARTPSTCGSRRPSLTPLGFFSKPVLTRRLSEAFLDLHKVMGSPTKPKMKRISSELTWRPNSTPGLNLSPSEEDCRKNISHTASCNTLQVPRNEIEEVCMIVDEEVLRITKRRSIDRLTRPSRSSANLFLQRVFRIDQEHSNKKATVIKTVLESTPKRSPRILITRAFSEESDKTTSVPPSPAKEILNKKLSSSTTLIERRWRQLHYQDEDSDNENCQTMTMRPLLSSAERESNRSSESSDTSDMSTGKIYMALDSNHVPEDIENDATEDQLLLSWSKYENGDTPTLKTKSSLIKQSLVKGQPEEIVL